MRPPIDTIHLFPQLDQKLIELLGSLSPEDWQRPTIARLWNVKDVAAHLLHGNVRTLSASRDGDTGHVQHTPSFEEIVQYLNQANAEWVRVWQTASTRLLTDLLEYTGRQFCTHLATLDPFGQALYSVSWAGENTSQNWFHIAREYTEKWHHQQQIRDVVQQPGIMTKELYGPCLQTFMLALPHAYRNTTAPAGTVLQITITGEGGGDWFLIMNKNWELHKKASGNVVAHTVIDGAVAWKLFTKSWRKNDVADHVQITGNRQLGSVVLDMISVMA